MDVAKRPLSANLFATLLVLAALATGYVGLSAYGYLVPAATLLLLALLIWLGRGRRFFIAIVVTNLMSELISDLVLLLGDGLGAYKLDLSGVAMLINLLVGGPLLLVLSIPLLATLWLSPYLRRWMNARDFVHV